MLKCITHLGTKENPSQPGLETPKRVDRLSHRNKAGRSQLFCQRPYPQTKWNNLWGYWRITVLQCSLTGWRATENMLPNSLQHSNICNFFPTKSYQQPTTPLVFVVLSWGYCDSLGVLLSDSHLCHCHPQIPTTDIDSLKWQRLADSNLKIIFFTPVLTLVQNVIKTSSLRWKQNLHWGISTGNLNHNN